MTPTEMKLILYPIFGTTWQRRGADALGISYTHMNKMANGRAAITKRTEKQIIELSKNPPRPLGNWLE